MKNKIYKILDNNLIGSYETKQKCADEILRLFGVSGRSEQLVCDMCGSSKLEECGSNEYSCEECGHFPITN